MSKITVFVGCSVKALPTAKIIKKAIEDHEKAIKSRDFELKIWDEAFPLVS
jgi:hypothetical protein